VALVARALLKLYLVRDEQVSKATILPGTMTAMIIDIGTLLGGAVRYASQLSSSLRDPTLEITGLMGH
jgi:hypothetical protein